MLLMRLGVAAGRRGVGGPGTKRGWLGPRLLGAQTELAVLPQGSERQRQTTLQEPRTATGEAGRTHTPSSEHTAGG